MMQARRNPSRAATKSQASVRVQRQCPVLAACSRDVPARVQTKRRSPSRIADLRIRSARRKQGATHRTDCVRRSRMSAQSDGVTGWSGITWQASWKIRVSSVGSRDTLVAMRRHNDFSSHGHSTRGVRPWLRTWGSRVSHDGRVDCDIGVRTEQSERSRRQVLAVGCNRDKFAGRASARISTGQCNYPGAIVIQLARLMPTDGDTQRGCTKFFPS